MKGSVVITAHNEQAVIARTLDLLGGLAESGEARVVVVPNGCVDQTAEIARSYAGVVVSELTEASKALALREGDRLAGPGSCIYLDADITLSSRAASAVFDALSNGAVAGRPPHVFDSSRASMIVRAWYRVRQDLPSISRALWGAGCYALSEGGRDRFEEFPDVVSDDLFINSLFAAHEVTIVPTEPLIVTTPSRTADLVRILRRSYRTQTEVAPAHPGFSQSQRAQLDDLRAIVRQEPRRIAEVAVYVGVIVYARVRARLSSSETKWERDESSRSTR